MIPLLAKAKQRIGQRRGSGATASEGAQNMLCAYLAVGVLTGLVLNVAFGLCGPTWPSRSASPRSR